MKDKRLSEDEDLTAAIMQELTHLVVPAQLGSNLAKVQGRLLSHKVIAAEVHTVLEEIRVAVFPELKKPAAAEAEDDESEDDVPARLAKKAKTVEANSDEDGEEVESDVDDPLNGRDISDDNEDEDDGWESGTVHGESDGEGEDDSGEEDGEEASEVEGGGVESDEDGDESDDDDDVPAPSKRQPAKAASSKASTSKQGESTFLPSLSVGFTRGDSDASDLSDAEVERADAGARKNRRGQRARRA